VAAYSIYSHLPSTAGGRSSIHNLRMCHAVVTGNPPNMDFYDKLMKLTLLLSIRNIVSHIIREDLKMLKQKSHTLLFNSLPFFNAYCKNYIHFFTEQLLTYLAVSGAIKHLEAIKPLISLLASFTSSDN
jgi:hypothetical protein